MTIPERISRASPLKLIKVEMDDGYLDHAIVVSKWENIDYEAFFFYEDNPFQSWTMIFKDGEIVWQKY